MKEKFIQYELIDKEYCVIREKRKKLKIKIDKEMRKAYHHARDYFNMYLELGTTGILGARYISTLLKRYENGEKSYRLYKEMMSIE